jgi:hypothetical protein
MILDLILEGLEYLFDDFHCFHDNFSNKLANIAQFDREVIL